MKLRHILINGLLVAITVFLIGCSNEGETSAFNKDLFDLTYAYDTAIIDLKTEVITVEVESWTDYQDGEQLQIKSKDGTVFLTSSYNCTLIKSK